MGIDGGTEIKRRRIGRSVVFAVVLPIVALAGMVVLAGMGVPAAVANSSFIPNLFVLAWMGLVVLAMVGVHDLMWRESGGTTSLRLARGFGSFVVASVWLTILGKVAFAITHWIVRRGA
jgi:predicted neutral ceramidase superfamily lipid hydrolase